MHFRQKLTFMALGSILTIAGYLLATLTSDVTAQLETDKSEPLIVDEIVCRKLRVVDKNDKTRVEIGANFLTGYMDFKTSDGAKAISISAFNDFKSMTFWNGDKDGLYMGASSDGGHMKILRASGKGAVSMGVGMNTKKGFVNIWGKNGKRAVEIGSDPNGGGYMDVWHASGKKAVSIGVDMNTKEGFVSAWGKEGGLAQLTATEYGGALDIAGKTDGKSRVLIGISERGNGTINTWDKNDNRRVR